MTPEDLRDTLDKHTPPASASPLLQALWYDAKGDWIRAHEAVQDIDTPDAAWVHAYLHRKEGDASNARYWYVRAKRSVASGSLEDEWADLVSALS